MEQHEALCRLVYCPLRTHDIAYLKAVTTVRLSIDHIQNIVLLGFAHRVAFRPIVASSALVQLIEVLGVVYILVAAGLYPIQDL